MLNAIAKHPIITADITYAFDAPIIDLIANKTSTRRLPAYATPINTGLKPIAKDTVVTIRSCLAWSCVLTRLPKYTLKQHKVGHIDVTILVHVQRAAQRRWWAKVGSCHARSERVEVGEVDFAIAVRVPEQRKSARYGLVRVGNARRHRRCRVTDITAGGHHPMVEQKPSRGSCMNRDNRARVIQTAAWK